jgi:hypothetical protein
MLTIAVPFINLAHGGTGRELAIVERFPSKVEN